MFKLRRYAVTPMRFIAGITFCDAVFNKFKFNLTALRAVGFFPDRFLAHFFYSSA